jgi:acetylornithine deacetylase/succinyl-diaminopimelate desuccinylase-like protein
MAEHFPGVASVPTVSAGFTDSHYLREQGIASYGFAPFVIPVGDTGGYHGNNERISVENIDLGVELLTRIVTEVVNPGAGPTAAEVAR